MKKLLLLSASVLSCIASQAQWTVQNSGFSTNRSVYYHSIVDASNAWCTSYISGSTPTQDYSVTTNGGSTWTVGTVTGASGLDFSNICAVTANDCWVAMYDGTNGGGGIFRTSDGGSTWTRQDSAKFMGPTGFPNFVHMFSSTRGFCVGDPNPNTGNGAGFEIYTTTNGGANWVRTPVTQIPLHQSGEYAYTDVYAVNGNSDIWFGTNKGRVFKSTDGGLNWTVSNSGYQLVQAISMKDASYGIIKDSIGIGTNIKKTTDGGVTWTPITVSGPMKKWDIEYVPGTADTWISSSNGIGSKFGGTAYSLDGGQNWTQIDTVQHTFIEFLDINTGYTGGINQSSTTGGVFKWTGITLGQVLAQAEKGKALIYPNPVSGNTNVSFTLEKTAKAEMNVVNTLGECVFHEDIGTLNAGLQEWKLDASAWPAGVYFVTISTEHKRITEKFSVSK